MGGPQKEFHAKRRIKGPARATMTWSTYVESEIPNPDGDRFLQWDRPPCAICGKPITKHQSFTANGVGYYHWFCTHRTIRQPIRYAIPRLPGLIFS